MASYYLCTLGEVLHAALPVGMKLVTNSGVPGDRFSEEGEDQLLYFLPDEGMKMKELISRLGDKVSCPASVIGSIPIFCTCMILEPKNGKLGD